MSDDTTPETAPEPAPGIDRGPETPNWFDRSLVALVRWCQGRPFAGGLLLIVSGVAIFLSGNLDITAVQVHLGVTGFLSYIIPLFLLLCGALVWATPSQRMFYGILGVAASIYSIISVNIGGWVVGMLAGIVGGSLAVAWVPDKNTPSGPVGSAADEPPTGDLDAVLDPVLGADGVATTSGQPEEDGQPVSTGAEGEQSATFPGPRHSRAEASEERHTGEREHRRALTPRRRLSVSLTAMALVVSAVVIVTLRPSTPAAAADCAPSVSQLKKPAGSTSKAATGRTTTTPVNPKKSAAASSRGSAADQAGGAAAAPQFTRNGQAEVVPQAGRVVVAAVAAPLATDDPDPLGGLLGSLGGLLGLGSGAASDSPAPSDAPSETPTAEPSTSAPTPPAAPTKTPPTTAPPATHPSPMPSKSTPPRRGKPPTPRPRPSTTAPCNVVPKTFAAGADQGNVQGTPSKQTAATLTMSGVSYIRNVALPTSGGTITVMEFSLASSTSTPFQLDSDVNGHVIRTNSSSLTVSGNVTFYATEVKGLFLGLGPVDYTPDNPPLILPTDVELSDATIGLVDVICDTLTAKDLSISTT